MGASVAPSHPTPQHADGDTGRQVNRIPHYPTQRESGRRNTGAAAGRSSTKIAAAARPNASSGTSVRPAVEAHRNRAGQGPLRPSLALPGRARPLISTRVRRRPAHAGQRAVDRKKLRVSLATVESPRRRGARDGRAQRPPEVTLDVLPIARRDLEQLRQILDLQRRLADERLTPGGHKAPGGKGRRGSGIVGICDREATQSRRDSAGRSSSWP